MFTKIKNSFYGLRKYEPLLKELVIRDIKVRYRRSILGLLWTVLNPLLMMVVMTTVFSKLFVNDIENFSVYYLTGYILYMFVNESTNSALFSVVYNGTLMKKVYIPKYMFPLSKVASSLVNLGFSFIAMFIVMILTCTKLQATILLTPLIICYVTLFATGLGLILSTIYVFFRDCGHFYGVVMLVWMYLTPLFYPKDILGEQLQHYLVLNPLYHYVTYFRMIILDGVIPGVMDNIICFSMGMIALGIGIVIFYMQQDKFILYI